MNDNRLNIIYCRQSLEKKDSLSVEGQEDKCKAMLGGEPYELYVDKGWSGKNINRPAFQKVMKLIKQNKVKRLVTYRLDRLSRSIIDFSELVCLFEEHDVTFISSSENIDLSSAAGKLMANILSVFAEFERNSIQERTKDSYYRRLESGIFTGGTVTGFDIIKTNYNGHNVSTLKQNKDINLIKRIFELYHSTEGSIYNVTLKMNKEYQTNYHTSQIGRMLRNPVYVKVDASIYNYYKVKGVTITNDIDDFTNNKGCFLLNKKEFKNNPSKCTLYPSIHEGFIDAKLFLAVQKKLEDNSFTKRKNTGKLTWLVNVKCNKCHYSAQPSPNGSKVYYVRCVNRLRAGTCEGISSVKLTDVEEVVRTSVLNKLEELRNINIQSNVLSDNKNNARRTEIDNELLSITYKIDTYLEKLLLASDSLVNVINEKVNQLEQRRIELQNELMSLDDELEEECKLGRLIDNIDWDSLDVEGKKRILKLLVHEIRVDEGNVYIEYKI